MLLHISLMNLTISLGLLCTRSNGIISKSQREHANDCSQTRTLPVGDHAHGYTRRVHAEIRGSALEQSDLQLGMDFATYNNVRLRRGELQLFGELGCPC